MPVSPTRPVTPESSWVPGRLPKPTRHPISIFFPLPYTQVLVYGNSFFSPSLYKQIQLVPSLFFPLPRGSLKKVLPPTMSRNQRHLYSPAFGALPHLRCPTLSKKRVRSAPDDASTEEDNEEEEECIGIGLGLGTHGFGFGRCAGWTFYGTGNRPLPHLPKTRFGPTSGCCTVPPTPHLAVLSGKWGGGRSGEAGFSFARGSIEPPGWTPPQKGLN